MAVSGRVQVLYSFAGLVFILILQQSYETTWFNYSLNFIPNL